MNDFSMEPEFSTRISFRMGAVFPADEPVAQWIVNLGRGSNDLLIATRRLTRGLQDDSMEQESFYDIRAIARHSWELAKFIEESRRKYPEVASFVSSLEPDFVRTYEEVVEMLDSDVPTVGSEAMWPFRKALVTARDQASHYSKIGNKRLRNALRRVSDLEGEVLVGPDFKDFNALFAALVDAQAFHPLEEDPEPFRQFSILLQMVVSGLTRFCRHSTDHYLLSHEHALTYEDYTE